jgi:hypothetical protein
MNWQSVRPSSAQAEHGRPMVAALHLARRRLQRTQAICDLFNGLLLVGAEVLVVVLVDASILRQLTIIAIGQVDRMGEKGSE